MNTNTTLSKNEVKKSVWTIEEGEVRKPGLSHFVMMALFSGIGVVVGTFGSLAVPLGYVTAFWPGQAIQSVGSIWYGAWGGIAGALFPLISNAISGSAPLPVSMAYIPGNLAQAIIAGWAFRQFSADPRLLKASDWINFTFWGVIVSNLLGAAWGSQVLVWFKLIAPGAHLTVFIGWFIGNSVASWILGVVMLKFISPIVIKTKTFCKGYLA